MVLSQKAEVDIAFAALIKKMETLLAARRVYNLQMKGEDRIVRHKGKGTLPKSVWA